LFEVVIIIVYYRRSVTSDMWRLGKNAYLLISIITCTGKIIK